MQAGYISCLVLLYPASDVNKIFFINLPKIILDKNYQNMEDILDLSMENFNSFKSIMREYYHTALKNTYDCGDARTFKTICPRCNINELDELLILVSMV